MKKIIKLMNILLVCLLWSCSSMKQNLKEIKIEETFSQKEEEYYVLFYLEGCPSCKDTLKFFEISNFKEDIYCVNMIYARNYLTSVFKENLGIFKYIDIKINQVPTMFYILHHKVEKVLIGYLTIRSFSWTS